MEQHVKSLQKPVSAKHYGCWEGTRRKWGRQRTHFRELVFPGFQHWHKNKVSAQLRELAIKRLWSFQGGRDLDDRLCSLVRPGWMLTVISLRLLCVDSILFPTAKIILVARHVTLVGKLGVSEEWSTEESVKEARGWTWARHSVALSERGVGNIAGRLQDKLFTHLSLS